MTPMVRSLFVENTNPNTMEKPWLISTFRSLDVIKFLDALHPLLEKYYKWLPKFNGTNAITAEKHMREFYWAVSAKLIMDGDVFMMLFVLTLEGSARDWYLSLSQGSIINWDTFHQAFNKIWALVKEGVILLEKFLEAKMTKNEIVKEFTQRFENLLKELLDRYKPTNDTILDQYVRAFIGHMTYALRDKKPQSLDEAKALAAEIEQKMNATRIAKPNA